MDVEWEIDRIISHAETLRRYYETNTDSYLQNRMNQIEVHSAKLTELNYAADKTIEELRLKIAKQALQIGSLLNALDKK